VKKWSLEQILKYDKMDIQTYIDLKENKDEKTLFTDGFPGFMRVFGF